MLKSILIAEGQSNVIGINGRHVHVVLASGTIRARVYDNEGSVYDTNLVQGMAVDFARGYKLIEFSADTAQQCQIWLSELPLTYTSDATRSVGAAALESGVVEAFSGQAYELMPAAVGRNKVTLYAPTGNVVIGGTNLNQYNGIPLPAGQAFTLEIQGAVYALETSGSFDRHYTARLSAADMPNYSVIDSPALSHHLPFGTTDDGQFVYTMNAGGTNAIYRVDVSDPASYTTLFWGNDVHVRYGIQEDGKIYTVAQNTTRMDWKVLDIATGAISTVAIPDTYVSSGNRRCRHFDKRGDIVAAFDSNNEKLAVSIDGGASFAVGAGSPGIGAGTDRGVAIAPNGDIYICYDSALVVTTDNGDTFTAVPFSMAALGLDSTSRGLAIDNDGAMYVTSMSEDAVFKSLDAGVTWSRVLDIDGPNTIARKGNTVAVAGDFSYAYFSKSTDWIESGQLSASNMSQTGLMLGDDGALYAGFYDGAQLYRVAGQRIASGGLEIAYMAEVN